MNLPSSNSVGSARPVSSPPPISFFLVLPDGSCIPATSATRQIIMKQARSDARKANKIARQEKAAELQRALEDRAAARRLMQDLIELEQAYRNWSARFMVQVRPQPPQTKTSPVRKRSSSLLGGPVRLQAADLRPPSSWVVDDWGMRGVAWQQSYLGRKSAEFYPGAARDKWEYYARDEAVLRDPAGEPVEISNMGDDWIEIGCGWQAMEDASIRKNAKIQMRAIMAFDSDMSQEEMVAALRHFCETILGPLNLPYSAVIHSPPEHGDERNFHAHLAFSLRPMRRVGPYCWDIADDVCGELDGRDGVQMLRHLWAHSMSEAAERAGRIMRYTGLGYGARGLNLEAGEHLGEGMSAIVARGGRVWAHERNQIKNARNAMRRAMRDADRKIAALTAVRDAALKRIETDRPIAAGRTISMREPVAPMARVEVATRIMPGTTAVVSTTDGAMPSLTEAAAAKPARAFARAEAAPSLADMTVTVTPSAGTAVRSATVRKVAPYVRASTILKRSKPSRAAEASLRSPDAFRAASRALHTPIPEAVPLELTISPVPDHVAKLLPPERVRSGACLTGSTAPSSGVPIAHHELLRVLAQERRARDRKCLLAQRRERWRQIDRHDEEIAEALPTLTQLAAHPQMSEAAIRVAVASDDDIRLAHIARMDPYVADYGGGTVEIVWSAMRAVGVDDAWIDRPSIQQNLRAIRSEQQSVVAALGEQAALRPLAFANAGKRFWPKDIDAEHLRRLNRWAADPGFQQDVFPIELEIRKAHQMRDEDRHRADRVPDGFGGWRDAPAPQYRPQEVRPRILPFDPASGAAHPSLIKLLRYAGTHPDRFAFADDGRIMALPGTAKAIEPSIHLWRNDDAVEMLVVETVSESRKARQPVWPIKYLEAIRALDDAVQHAPRKPTKRGSRRRPRPIDRGRGVD